MQAALPEPSPRTLEYLRRQESRSEGEKVAEAAAWHWSDFGLVGLLLAVPYLIIRLLRGARRLIDSTADDQPR